MDHVGDVVVLDVSLEQVDGLLAVAKCLRDAVLRLRLMLLLVHCQRLQMGGPGASGVPLDTGRSSRDSSFCRVGKLANHSQNCLKRSMLEYVVFRRQWTVTDHARHGWAAARNLPGLVTQVCG